MRKDWNLITAPIRQTIEGKTKRRSDAGDGVEAGRKLFAALKTRDVVLGNSSLLGELKLGHPGMSSRESQRQFPAQQALQVCASSAAPHLLDQPQDASELALGVRQVSDGWLAKFRGSSDMRIHE